MQQKILQEIILRPKVFRSTKLSSIIAVCLLLSACATTPKRITTSDWDLATQQVIAQYGPNARSHLLPLFEKADVDYPPKQIALLAFKKEHKLELWAKKQKKWTYIHTYPIRAKSGRAGPKLQQGDEQIPEGIYKILFLHPLLPKPFLVQNL